MKKIVIGLGNPGPKYEGTRHNVGFMVIDLFSKRLNLPFKKIKFHSLVAEKDGILLMKAQTFMNDSGVAVGEASRYYNIDPKDILVIYDDISLPFAKMRIRGNGRDGGHNGVKSIIAHLESQEFPRIKIGVGAKPNPEMDLVDHVLSQFTSSELTQLKETLSTAGDAIESWILVGTELTMSKMNPSKEPPAQLN
jgi:PTH1 family peptidyl-tRNA hydrolase